MRRTQLSSLALVLCVGSLAACGDEEAPPEAAVSDLATQTIEVTFEGDTVTPNGDRVDVKVGQEIALVVDADALFEIHVHPRPAPQL